MGYVVMQTRAATPIVGDLNNDGVVNVFDLSILLSHWGTNDATSDINHDGTVNIFDLSSLLSHWGQSSTPTPTSTPSVTPTPTPSPTPSGIPQSTCTSPVYSSADYMGTWTAPNGDYTNNNVWNPQNGGTQTINVCNTGSWYVSANWIDNPSSPGDIMSYASSCRCNFSQAMSTFHSLTSTFAETTPYQGEWNFAYDIFMASGQEIMVDNDQNNHGTGLQQGGIAATIDGVPYHVIKGGNTIYFLRDVNARSGSIDFVNIYKWVVAQGWNSMSDKLNLFGYGVEISYTESSPGHQGPQRFDLTNWTLTAN